MKRETAWNGFYKTLKEINELNTLENKIGWKASISNERQMKKLKIRKYAKSLVLEHDWQDIHTKEYFRKEQTL